MPKLKFSHLSILLFLSITICAQNDEKVRRNWQPFQPKGEEFTVISPILFNSFVYDEKVINRRFTGVIENRFLFISSDHSTQPLHYEKVQELLNKTVYKSRREKLDNFEVQKISFDYSDDFFHKMWIVKTKERIYIFHTASEIENDEIINRFFESIKIDRKLEHGNENTELVFGEGTGISGSNISNKQERQPGNSINKNTSSNSGISAVLPKPVDLNNSPMLIQSKPRANYTDFAQFFDIQGTVNLRITFLETGEIGTINVITKMPFGLTRNAIEAAQKMRFKPMKQGGISTSVTKIVQYTFTIY